MAAGAQVRESIAHRPDFGTTPFVIAFGIAAVAAPIVSALLTAAQSRAASQQANTENSYEYDVASIKPNKGGGGRNSIWLLPDGLTATNVTLLFLIRDAYGVADNQVSGGPNWLNSEKYDIQAKMGDSAADALHKLNKDEWKVERQRMLQALLADRFKLTLHEETKELPVYALVVARHGPRLQEAKPGDTYPNGIKDSSGVGRPGTMSIKNTAGGRELIGQGVPVASLSRTLSQELMRTVLDKTGLTGSYNFMLR